MKKKTERIKDAAAAALIFTVLYLFYRSFWVLTLLLPCMIIYRKVSRKERSAARARLLNRQFKDMMDSLSASLRAGYSVENALKEALREMKIMHGEDSPIYIEISLMLSEISLGITAEEAFSHFAERCATEDTRIFASVFSIAQRSGGDMISIVQKTADEISARADTRNEIEVLISARKLEMNIMSGIPLGIILYIDLTSGGLLDPLYGNPLGITVMTVCLIIYAASVLLGRKMTDIEV
ncbi:MAG: type II secretion system F family protein [Parasporobacterium sp.]|nr:type II secretion system F family protein [Parasporobacterium sp.]